MAGVKDQVVEPWLDDGYSVMVGCVTARPLLPDERRRIIRETRGNGSALLDAVFRRPYVFGDIESLTESEQITLLDKLMQYDAADSDFRNLVTGVELRIKRPEAADVSCDLCRKWLIDYDRWTIRCLTGTSLPIPRGDGELLCETPGGCVRGHWQNPVALSQKNTQCWNHYWEWRLAGMPLPECRIMRRNWKTIEWGVSYGFSRRACPAIR